MNPLISVIIPIYNVKDYLNECIISVIRQSYKNIEIILVDDGSTDESADICDAYEAEDNRVRVIHKVNEGLSSARNIGIKIARGEYLSFIDSDDYIHADMLNILLQEMIKNQADVACCDYSSEKISIDDKTVIVLNKENAISRLLDEDGYKCYAWNKLYKRKLFENISYPEGKWFEDITTTYNVFKNVKTVVYVKQKLYFYRLRKNSITQSKFSMKDRDLLIAINYVIDDSKWLSNSLQNRIMAGYICYFFYYIKKGIRANAMIEEDINFFRKFILNNIINVILNDRVNNKFKIEILLLLLSPNAFSKFYNFFTK